MIESKFKYENEDKWNYKDFNSKEEMLECFEKDPRVIVEYDSREKKINNPFKNWWNNIRNTKKNWKKVQGSPYASLTFALKARKLIIGILIPFIGYRIYDMVANFRGTGGMAIFTKLFMIGVGVFMIWKLYSTIPMAKKQIDYYKKYPHLINYCPTNTKETVDDIFKKIEANKQKGGQIDGTRNREKA